MAARKNETWLETLLPVPCASIFRRLKPTPLAHGFAESSLVCYTDPILPEGVCRWEFLVHTY